jgi:pimeloyl-ACP methyl ester carboxylesterase
MDGTIDAVVRPSGDSCTAADRPYIFLHEGLGSIELWRDVPDRLRASVGAPPTLVYSRHGYGTSGPPQLPRLTTYMHHEADHVLPVVLAESGVAVEKMVRPILIGHSDGASIALLYAGRIGATVAALVLIAPHVFVETITITAIEASRTAYETGNLRQKLSRYHLDVDTAFYGWNNAWLAPEFRTWNIEDRLANITCPVLLIQGEVDPYGTTAQLDAIESGVRGPITRVLLPGVGHAPHLEAPEPTIGAVTRFINGL